jgi:transposase
MPHFKDYDYNQMKMIPISFDKQILQDSFEYSLSYLIDHEIDQSIFYHRYINDKNGAPAYDPAILLKIVILAYSKGITSSRKIEALCRENIIFMAISADSQPHFTTLADFVSRSHKEIAILFKEVLLICDHLGLIGKEMFAIDGCKLPSNASKEWSGTHEELEKKYKKIDKAVDYIVEQHQANDQQSFDPESIDRIEKQKKKLKASSKKIKQFLKTNEKRKGKNGTEVKSNITDNESAKITRNCSCIACIQSIHGHKNKSRCYTRL